jgi:hypothetical protein
MFALKLTAPLDADQTFVLSMPPEVQPGLYEIVLVLSKQQGDPDPRSAPLDQSATDEKQMLVLPTHDVGPWPAELSLSREDLYDEWGR